VAFSPRIIFVIKKVKQKLKEELFLADNSCEY